MQITYKVNGVNTTKALTEWFFGKKFVAINTKKAEAAYKHSGNTSTKVWQDGTGYLTIEIC